jgi:hypothetical protein
MKKKVGQFFLLLFLLSACGKPVSTEQVPVVQRTQTPSPIITHASSVKPTSTIDQIQQASGGFAFCQVAPREARLGSSVNISAFRLPPNHPISIFIYYDSNEIIQLPSNFKTDENGYVNFDLGVPVELPTETWSRIGLIAQGPLGPVSEASCGIWPWTEISLATYSAWQTEINAPTLTPPPKQAAVTATQQALHNKLDKYCIYHNQARGLRFSPNSQWVEVFCSTDTLEIVRLDETQKWEVSSDTLINPYTEYFGGVNHWSNDGAYAYITFDPHTDGYWEPYHQGIVLYRLDLQTGQISEVLPLGKSDWIFYSFAFSSNDRRLAYIVTDKSPVILNIRDMQTGNEQPFEFDPKYNTGGRFVWSPDSQKLVFSITQFDTNIYDYIATSIILWDKDKSELTELITDYQGELRANEWINETKIALDAVILDQGQLETRKYELDLANNELTEINP